MSQNLIILIIEPSQTEQFLYSEIFSASEFKIINCSSAVEALTILNANSQIGLVITDLYLPDLIGVELLHKIRTASRVPIIIVSSIPFQKHEVKSFTNIETFYKPYNMSQLLKTVLSIS